MNRAFWRGKRIMLTGHTGFKGSWLSIWLKSLDAEVLGYALAPSTNPSLFEVGHGMASVVADIRDLAYLQKVMVDYQPEIVIHMAAQPLVRYSYLDPVGTYSTNVMGTVNLFEAIRQTKSVKAVVNVTSDKCYENREWAWGYRENEAMGGFDPYSSSKGCSELVTAAYRNSYFNPGQYEKHGVAIASGRAGNVIGGGDWAEDRLIPDMMRAISSGNSVNIRSPKSIRPWQHVLEPLSGYLLLAEKLYLDGANYSEAWNFGPNDDDTKSVEWIADNLTRAWGEGASWHLEYSTQVHEAQYLKLDCSKAKTQLEWVSKWSLIKAIDQICIWHKAHIAGADMHEISLQQIGQYEMTS